MNDWWGQAFGGIERLYGKDRSLLLKKTHICVIGIGGVGSWSAEALARSGVGSLTLIDLDDICSTNTNRQIHSLFETVGKSKVLTMKKRLESINPYVTVQAIEDYYTPSSAQTILKSQYSIIIDAIDSVGSKVDLISRCHKKRQPILTVGGAAGKIQTHRLKVSDLAHSFNDPLLRRVRKKLRREHGFSTDPKQYFDIPCIFSSEPMRYPDGKGSVCARPSVAKKGHMDCQTGIGSASFVTGAFGFAAASLAINKVLDEALY